MIRVAMFNDEERVVRTALEEFIERRRKYTANNTEDAQHVHDRGVARELLHDIRNTIPEPDPVGYAR